jgi:hypothetical protein
LTPTPAVLDTLLARVRAATGPDTRLDWDILDALFLVGGDVSVFDLPRHLWAERRPGVAEAAAFTGSLDATTAAITSRGLGWQVDQTEGATVSDEHDQWHETCATPVLSLVGAWLVAEMERAAEA